MNKFENLAKMNIREKKRQIKHRLREQRNEQITKLQEIEQQKFKAKYDKKYNSLKMKMQ